MVDYDEILKEEELRAKARKTIELRDKGFLPSPWSPNTYTKAHSPTFLTDTIHTDPSGIVIRGRDILPNLDVKKFALTPRERVDRTREFLKNERDRQLSIVRHDELIAETQVDAYKQHIRHKGGEPTPADAAALKKAEETHASKKATLASIEKIIQYDGDCTKAVPDDTSTESVPGPE